MDEQNQTGLWAAGMPWGSCLRGKWTCEGKLPGRGRAGIYTKNTDTGTAGLLCTHTTQRLISDTDNHTHTYACIHMARYKADVWSTLSFMRPGLSGASSGLEFSLLGCLSFVHSHSMPSFLLRYSRVGMVRLLGSS